MTTLAEHLDRWAGADPDRGAIAATMAALAAASAELAEFVALGALAGAMGTVVGESNDGDGQKALDVHANGLFLDHLRAAPVAAIASEELAEPVANQPGARLAVALDPLDGSNNVDQNAPMGSIFTLLRAAPGQDSGQVFRQTGEAQQAAGLVLYGACTTMAITLGDGVQVFTLDRRDHTFRLTRDAVRVPPARREYAINASNARHWSLPIRAYVEECLAGSTGPRGADYNTRWVGCVVADAYRILLRGGIYLYPGDARSGYERGRLRLVYEANPIAMLMDQAGGAATDGFTPITEIEPRALHQRVPLIFGSRDKVTRVTELHMSGIPQAGQRPLFGTRGLFKS